ncbi:cysteine--tRNA ligase [uncultured Anaerococcus sp.]|uniref:cysteine--tRNA ligase n=1 Tax=uncultured Anaerococcus sp. TaxID=293428 RepID=UPI0025D83470|nr:cysteine--tRNA ligase [uncultured Anaerococcus sp.]
MKIYNTLTRKKEVFKPIEEGKIKMYVCGPTVYDYMHIGNARPLVVFDTFRRFMDYRGYDVTYVVNFTDVDDKIIKKSIEEGITTKEVTDRYIDQYMADAHALNLDEEDTIHPRATEVMDDIIDFVKGLIDKGMAYESNGDVYFDVSKKTDYGKLSKKNLDDLVHGASHRLDDKDAQKKKSPADFTLWKATKIDGEVAWDSPWGKGRPGWHIECSTMSKKILGETIDIHAGGEDLQFPHHENEIAQSEGLNEVDFANYWLHNGMIQVNGAKMSKSVGNFFTLDDIKKEYDLMTIRFWLLTASYRQPINFTKEIIESAQNSLDRLNNAYFKAEETLKNAKEIEITDSEKDLVQVLSDKEEEFISVMEDDLNTADAITVLFDLAKFINTNISATSSKDFVEKTFKLYQKLYDILGLIAKKKEAHVDEDFIEEKISERDAAKKVKDFALADKIRDDLKEKGIILKDTREGTKWEIG